MSYDIISMYLLDVPHISLCFLIFWDENLKILKYEEIWKISKNIWNLKISTKYIKIWKTKSEFEKQNLKIWKISKLLKKIKKSGNLKILKVFQKISKSEKYRTFWKRNLKIKNPTFVFPKSKVQLLFFSSRKIFLVKISCTKYLDHSFMCKTYICDFRSVAISFSRHRHSIIIFIMILHSHAGECDHIDPNRNIWKTFRC